MLRRTFLGVVSCLLAPLGIEAREKPRPSRYPGLTDMRFGPWMWIPETGPHIQSGPWETWKRATVRRYRDGTARIASPIVYKKDWDTRDDTGCYLSGVVRVREYQDSTLFKGEPWLFIYPTDSTVEGSLPTYRAFEERE